MAPNRARAGGPGMCQAAALPLRDAPSHTHTARKWPTHQPRLLPQHRPCTGVECDCMGTRPRLPRRLDAGEREHAPISSGNITQALAGLLAAASTHTYKVIGLWSRKGGGALELLFQVMRGLRAAAHPASQQPLTHLATSASQATAPVRSCSAYSQPGGHSRKHNAGQGGCTHVGQ